MPDPTDEMARILAQADRPRRGWLWWGLAVLLIAGLGGWYWYARTAKAAAVSYETAAVTRGDVTVTVTATGSVQPTTEVEISSELSGSLASVEVDYNDQVTVGQVLARLDDTKLKSQVLTAEAQLAAARASLAQAEAVQREAAAYFDAQSELDKRGQSSRLSLITQEAARDKAEAALTAAKADVALAEARLSEARADLDRSAILSPINGIVLDRAAEPGQIVASSLNAPVLFTLAEDLARMELRVDVDEADIGRIAVGNEASFTVDAYPGQSFPAVIESVRYAPETTDGVVTFKAILSVDNSRGLLRPGMTATSTIAVSVVKDTLLVPDAAVRFEPPQEVVQSGSGGGGRGLVGMIMPRRPMQIERTTASGETVWVLRSGVATEVPVTVGDSDGRKTAVSGEGLAEGDLVIIDQKSGS